MYVLASDGRSELHQEFVSCRDLNELDEKYRKAFIYCSRKIHKLPYYPQTLSSPCHSSGAVLRNFIERNNISIVFFKGGIMEKRLCEYIGMRYFNIEAFFVPKVPHHEPKEEVWMHFKYLERYCRKEIEDIM